MPQRPPRQGGTGGSDGINRVGLALTTTDLTVRSIDFNHGNAGPVEISEQPGAIRAGALHTDRSERAE
jgi:hypothetical protein